MTICTRSCCRRLHADTADEVRRPCLTGRVTYRNPRHQRLLKRCDQRAAGAQSTCVLLASAVEAVDASSAVSALDIAPPEDGLAAKLVAIVPEEALSHFGIPWTKVMAQMARRLSWVDPAFQMQVHQGLPALLRLPKSSELPTRSMCKLAGAPSSHGLSS